MKTLKIFYLSFLIIFIASCEKEPLHSNEEIAPKTMQANYSISYPFIGVSESRLYNSPEELQNDCDALTTDWDNDWDRYITAGITISLTGMHYFGTYLYVTGGEDLITIEVRDSTNEIIYKDRILIGSDLVYFGIATEYPMGEVLISKESYTYLQALYFNNTQFGNCDFFVKIDTDGDGIPDDEDFMPNSNMEETVVIEDCDSSVGNIALGEGYMLSDRIDELEAGDYKNHGQFVKATAHYLNSLVEEGILTYEEREMIMACAGSSLIGK